MQSNVVATVVQGHTFTVDPRYEPGKILGRGSFGVVCTAVDKVRNQTIAIKRIRPFANDEWDARHTLREIRLMKLLGRHPNVISLYELSIFEDKSELYMMMELMDCDLHRIIQSKQPLNDMHYKCFARQMLEGIKAMHQVGVFHRDLKPGNILVSKDCQLRITDFGLARFMDEETLSGQNRQNPLTEYVVTRWYRCPELLLSPNLPYGAAIDIWSIGCIIGELIKRKPLFPGKSHANQVQLILEVRGYKGPRDVGFELSSEASSFLDRRCKYPGKSLSSFIPQCTDSSLRLLEQLLQLNPKLRPTADQALQFDYINDAQVMCDYTDVATTPRRVDERFFDFEREDYKLEELQKMVRDEVMKPCDDSIFFDSSPTKKVKLHNNKSASSATSGHVPKSSPSKKKSTSSRPSSHQRRESDTNITESDEGYRTEISGRRSKDGDNSDGKMVIARSHSAPPSPSPHKVDIISKQEKKQKRRFFLQGIQRMKQDTDGIGSHDSSRSDATSSSRSTSSNITPSEQMTSRVHHQQMAGGAVGMQRGIQPVSARAKYLNNSMVNSETAPVDLRAMDYHSAKKGSNVLNNFRDINFGSREGARQQLNSAPPPSDRNSAGLTRLPSLKGSKRSDRKS
mmetsp:Transcript_25784/g.43471  ORF Transcript_25784/g.43471 Transcript_25784/m.43471 type:complete len:626 (-) Transcript_25784:341-2218(-)|eukprot:CAMPEP_0114427438 /NCGR_PEP_ID=MMETSP0103-20121206/8349_1 /TAXON_ID=37642 ORGANISM="Paraphysomonas imperforata, Strain PA2" /NCGR_SAMPLE_ID=MMETSP0103 /ASSEMBLY_ACC=CAM_ASM_000201 /LENGTH=625 /DNA_ID=CAMNT_0001596501 /DNA_START=199 /DNA_END=2076 /DNA_ORIENTATION=+